MRDRSVPFAIAAGRRYSVSLHRSSRSVFQRGEAMSRLEMSAHLKIRPGQLEGFKQQAAEMLRLTKEKDTKTLRYDWFISRDGTECEVREAYESSEGLIEHQNHVAEARNKIFAEFAEDHVMTGYGEPSPELFNMVEAMQKAGHVKITWFSFLQGLEQPVRV